MNCHPNKYTYHVQVGDGYADHAYWGRPEEMDMDRPTLTLTTDKPGSEPTAEAAAALSTCYLIFKDENPELAENCIAHAKDLFDFATQYPAVYSDSIPEVADFYKSWNGYQDELAWASIWLFRATQRLEYLEKALLYYSHNQGGFGWDDKTAGYQVLMAQLTSDGTFTSDVRNYFNYLENHAPRTPKGKFVFPDVIWQISPSPSFDI